MRAAAPRVARAPELEAERREPGVVQLDQVCRELLGLGPYAFDSGLRDQLCPLLDGTECRNVGGAGQEATHAGLGVVGALHLELPLLAKPSLYRVS